MQTILTVQFIISCSLILGIFIVAGDSELVNVKVIFPSMSDNQGHSRLVLTRSIPDIREVTLCHWVTSSTSPKPKGSYTVSYATGKSPDEFLVGFLPTSDERKVYLQVSIQDQPAKIETTLFKAGHWHHVCVSWSSGSGRVIGYVDGQKIGEVEKVKQGATIRTRGSFIVGQDQDIFNGKFDQEEAWEGAIADLQMWDQVLAADKIAEMAQCKLHMDGNLVSWMKTPFRALNGVVLSEVNLCMKKLQMKSNLPCLF